jgi:hypothetical protein
MMANGAFTPKLAIFGEIPATAAARIMREIERAYPGSVALGSDSEEAQRIGAMLVVAVPVRPVSQGVVSRPSVSQGGHP